MENNFVCLAPYEITSMSLLRQGDFIFTDPSKNKQIVVFGTCENPPEQPAGNSILLQEFKDCNINCIIRWYEIQDELGRTYTLEITGCKIYITSFIDGFMSTGECRGDRFGTESFCFGKDYINSIDTEQHCTTAFVFDGHVFEITGHAETNSGLYDCSECIYEGSISTFGGVFTSSDPNPIPSPPAEAVDSSEGNSNGSDGDSAAENQNESSSNNQDSASWLIPDDWAQDYMDTFCSEYDSISRGQCESDSSPSIARLPSGQCLVAYTHRDITGNTKISLSITSTSVEKKILYHRSLSKGIIVNDNLSQNIVSFEIFEDVLFDVNNDGQPISPLYIGFINGPLRGGQTFLVSSINRSLDINSRPKQTVRFSSGGRQIKFNGSNNYSGVFWFITSDNSPTVFSSDVLNIPPHIYNGIQVPVSNPSITVAPNNLMVGTDQHVFLSYQAFENNVWRIYAIHIILSDKIESQPIYLEPYLFQHPVISKNTLESNGIFSADYKVIQTNNTANPNEIRVLFQVLLNDEPIQHCDDNQSTYTTTLGFQISDPEFVYTEAKYVISCGSVIPDWTTGTVFSGSIPLESIDIASGSDPLCIQSISMFPQFDKWCFNKSSCSQFFVINDPYCPDAYDDVINFQYKPEDLYVIKSGDEIVTRIKYHMSASVLDVTEASASDIMFVVDYSGSMGVAIENVRQAVPLLAQSLIEKGVDVRFGLTVYGQSNSSTPIPGDMHICGERLFNGLQFANNCNCSDGGSIPNVDGGFTRDVEILKKALCCWLVNGGLEPHWAAIQFAAGATTDQITDSTFSWRDSARKFIIFITDEPPNDITNAPPFGECLGYENNKESAIDVLLDKNMIFVPIVGNNVSDFYSDISALTGWNGSPYFDINSQSYEEIFSQISASIEKSVSGLRVLERDSYGYDNTFVKNAEIIISYQGDLSGYWTFNKKNFIFSDISPIYDSFTKGLSNFPFNLYNSKVYGIDPVHVIGNINNWVYFKTPGDIRIDYPSVGSINSIQSSPVIISNNGVRPVIKINQRNEVFIIYENYESGLPQIKIQGTGDFCQNSITGPKSKRITKILAENDFSFYHNITTSDDLLNQICDIHIDNSDVIHVTWQSNRDGQWEIYYANSCDIFKPVRVTNKIGRSGFPKIQVDLDGNIFIVYHDNRFGPFQIMLSYKEDKRFLPLLEQDPYIESQKELFGHYTNTLSILVKNTVDSQPSPGVFVFSKISSNDGNDDENYIFKLTDTLNIEGGGAISYEIIAMASNVDGYLYGITKNAELLQLDSPETENPYLDIEINEITKLADISFAIPVEGIIRIEDDFNQSNGSSFPNSNWIQQVNTIGFLSNANAKICDGKINICGSCPLSNCSSRYIGHYISTTRIVIEDRTVSIKSRVRWYDPANDPDKTGPSFIIYARAQPSGSDKPAPNYEIRLTHGINGDGNGRTLLVLNRSTVPLNLISVASYEFDVNENIWHNRWVDVRVDCADVDDTVEFRLFIDGIFRTTLRDTGSTAAGPTIQTHASGAFSYGFSVLADESSSGSGNITGALVDSFSVESIAQPLTNVTIVDAALDASDRLWVLTTDSDENGMSYLRLIYVDKNNGESIASSVISQSVTKASGGLAVLMDGTFFIVYYEGQSVKFQKSPYPNISNSVASFNFTNISNMSVNITALSTDHNDDIYGIDEENILYRINKLSGDTEIITDLSTSPYDDNPYLGANPIGLLSGFATLYTGRFSKTGSPGFFHVNLEFYNNIKKEGLPDIVVDSRSSLESFLVNEDVNDPYIEDAYFSGGKGVFLNENEAKYIFFDASHFRPGFSNNAHPYSFVTNRTYFPKVFLTKESGGSIESPEQKTSFSCNNCSEINNNVFDHHSCSFSFTVNSHTTQNIKLLVYFYADEDKQHIIETYTLTKDSAYIDLFEINNNLAVNDDRLDNYGLNINDQESLFIQVYPILNTNTGLLCGVNYYVSVYSCKNEDCTNLDRSPDNTELSYNSIFYCECASFIFNDRSVPLSALGRWRSSAFGVPDVRVTDLVENCINPTIDTKISGSSLILFEDHSSSPPTIKGSIFKISTQRQLFGSGTRSWFDYNTNTKGQKIDSVLDILDRIVIAYEIVDEHSGRGESTVELPSSAIQTKTCDFVIQNTIEDESLQCTILQNEPDESVSIPDIINKILIKEAIYHTYSSTGEVSPVVDQCLITLQIWAKPEAVAVRIKNENQINFSEWCPFSPQTSDYYIEKQWRLSGGSGVKKVCIQTMNYEGISKEFCITIISDYTKISYKIDLFADSEYTTELLKYKETFVANTKNTSTGLDELSKIIWIEITPLDKIEADSINFDVLHQGSQSISNLVASKVINSKGFTVFRGQFIIYKDDNNLNKDGFAQVVPKFHELCSSSTFLSEQDQVFVKDEFNNFVSTGSNVSDVLLNSRQNQSGKIGVDITIRPNEDPFLIFGDPDVRLKNNQDKSFADNKNNSVSSSQTSNING